jgi:hypothetical protein
MSRTNYIFIDFENVQETDFDRIANKPVKVTLVLGERHKSLSVTLVKKLLKYASQVELVETKHNGKNALDMVLAQHVGETKTTDPHGYFHIVSKDNDFKATIVHLKDNGTLAARYAAFCEIPVLMNAAERVERLAKTFKDKQNGRPLTRKALESQIQATFGKVLSAEEVVHTVDGLVKKQILAFSGTGEITYQNSGKPQSTVTKPVLSPVSTKSKPATKTKTHTSTVANTSNSWGKQILEELHKPKGKR